MHQDPHTLYFRSGDCGAACVWSRFSGSPYRMVYDGQVPHGGGLLGAVQYVSLVFLSTRHNDFMGWKWRPCFVTALVFLWSGPVHVDVQSDRTELSGEDMLHGLRR